MASRRRSLPGRQWMLIQNLLVLPALAPSAICSLPWYRCQTWEKKYYFNNKQTRKRGGQAPFRPKTHIHSPVNHVVGVQVSQPLKSAVSNCSNFNFLQRFLVNWRGKTINREKGRRVPAHHFATYKKKQDKPHNSPSNRSEADPRQYSMTSCNENEISLFCIYSTYNGQAMWSFTQAVCSRR